MGPSSADTATETFPGSLPMDLEVSVENGLLVVDKWIANVIRLQRTEIIKRHDSVSSLLLSLMNVDVD